MGSPRRLGTTNKNCVLRGAGDHGRAWNTGLNQRASGPAFHKSVIRVECVDLAPELPAVSLARAPKGEVRAN